MRLNSKHKHLQTGRVYELQLVQKPQAAKYGDTQQWLILKNAEQKYPISVSITDFEEQYEAI